jgi:hypothetical protein
MPELSLDAIGLKHGTDKASHYHDYLSFYDTLFSPRRSLPLTLLEVGVFNGASLRTWREYFPNARIIGADIAPHARRLRRDGIDIEYMDQSNLEDLVRVAAKHQPFDIIIEDGSHMWEHQKTSIKTLFPFLRAGGLYIVEDLQTNYGDYTADYRGVATSSCVEFLKTWLDLHVADAALPIKEVEDAFLRTYGHGARTITFYKRVCVIEKRELPLPSIARDSTPLAPQPSHDPRFVRVGLIAHVSHVGDVYEPEGYIDLGKDLHTLQGLAAYDADSVLEYRVRNPDRTWGPWINAPEYAGTRGRALLITGLTFRLREEAKGKYSLRTLGRFVGSPNVIVAADGEDCVAPDGAEMRGVQIELMRAVAPEASPEVDAA